MSECFKVRSRCTQNERHLGNSGRKTTTRKQCEENTNIIRNGLPPQWWGALLNGSAPHHGSSATSRLCVSVSNGERRRMTDPKSLRKSSYNPHFFPLLSTRPEWVSRRNVSLLCNSINRNSCHLDVFSQYSFFLFAPPTLLHVPFWKKKFANKSFIDGFYLDTFPQDLNIQNYGVVQEAIKIYTGPRPRAEENLCRNGTTQKWWVS